MKKPKYSKLFLLGFGFFGISIVWPLYNAYVPIFLKDFSLSSTSIGFIMTIDNIFAIFMLPLIGVLSDQTRTRLGRRMPYILFGAPLAGLFFSLIPVTRELHILWFMMLNIIFMNFFMALFRSPVIALMPDITPPKYRSQANGIINFMGGLGALLAYFVGKPLYDKHYALPFWLGALVMVLALILVVIFIKEDEKYKVKTGEKIRMGNVFKKSFNELAVNLKEVFASKEKSLLMMLLSILFWFIGYNALETFFTSYAKFRVGISESTGALILGFFSLTFMLFSIPAGFIGSKIGRRRTMTIGLVIVISITILTMFSVMMIEDLKTLTYIMFILFALGGLGWGMVNVNSLPTVVDMTVEEKVGGYTGLYYFFSMSANIIAPPLAGVFIDKIGYDSLIIFSALSFVIAAITLQFVKKGDVR